MSETVHPIVAEMRRNLAYQHAMQYWLTVGYSYMTAAYLASTLHGRTQADRDFAIKMMTMKTNLRIEDMI